MESATLYNPDLVAWQRPCLGLLVCLAGGLGCVDDNRYGGASEPRSEAVDDDVGVDDTGEDEERVCTHVAINPLCCNQAGVSVDEASCDDGAFVCDHPALVVCSERVAARFERRLREAAWVLCDGTLREDLDDPIAELVLEDGRFAVTWSSELGTGVPTYQGSWTFELGAGLLALEADEDELPEGYDAEGYAVDDGMGRVRLIAMWLGQSPQSRIVLDERPCGHLFVPLEGAP